MEKLVTIVRDDGRVVEGVTCIIDRGGWFKMIDGVECRFYPSHGWKNVLKNRDNGQSDHGIYRNSLFLAHTTEKGFWFSQRTTAFVGLKPIWVGTKGLTLHLLIC